MGDDIRKNIEDLGIDSVKDVRVVWVYSLEGQIAKTEIQKICRQLLVDPVVQEFSFLSFEQYRPPTSKNPLVIEIAYNPGVTDPVEESTLKGIRDLGVTQMVSVRASRKYILRGKLSSRQREVIVNKVLANKLIQHEVRCGRTAPASRPVTDSTFRVVTVDVLGADKSKLSEISRRGQLFLNEREMLAIKKHFRRQGRNPTDCELETVAQTWSEHCHHKTFRGDIRFHCEQGGRRSTKRIRNLLKSTIMRATKEIDRSWCVSVFYDNAGVIRFDKDSNLCFKVETHNHPSALEPFGGANTGIGGVIRDILGTGLSARPVCNTDVFCFAPPDTPFEALPGGTLHPKRVMKGVVGGVRDYGNKMGIPTVNGAILFDKRFVGNPLVYCGTVGIMPRNKVKKKARPGDIIVVAGGRTGRDGIHGATFSSGELTQESESISSGAVQIGDPIQEKKLLDVLLQARDKNLCSAVTDCGAGGLSSAVGEMGQKIGARVDLDKVPLKYLGLSYTEIWISESQERMVLAVPKKNVKTLLALFSGENVEATPIGEFTNTRRLELFFNGSRVADLEMDFLHNGIPNVTKEAVWKAPRLREWLLPRKVNLTKKLHAVLGHYNVCSKEWVIRQYDHEVQGGSVVKPLTGKACDGPSDASVIRPKLTSKKCFAVSNGINIRYGMIDPFWMAVSCVDEAIRQIVAVGGSPERIAILDNFCWGNPDKPDRLGALVRAAQGCYAAARDYGVPFISGKDSLYNEYTDKGRSISIPGTLLISAIGIIDDAKKTVTMDFKDANSLVYIIGETFDELGGSVYLDTYGALGSNAPQADTKTGLRTYSALSRAVKAGVVRSLHDCSEGGFAVSLAEMAFSGGKGATVFLSEVPFRGKRWRNDCVLFSESNARFVAEILPENQKAFEEMMKGVPWGLVGCTEDEPVLTVYGLNGQLCIEEKIGDLKRSWKKTLDW